MVVRLVKTNNHDQVSCEFDTYSDKTLAPSTVHARFAFNAKFSRSSVAVPDVSTFRLRFLHAGEWPGTD